MQEYKLCSVFDKSVEGEKINQHGGRKAFMLVTLCKLAVPQAIALHCYASVTSSRSQPSAARPSLSLTPEIYLITDSHPWLTNIWMNKGIMGLSNQEKS